MKYVFLPCLKNLSHFNTEKRPVLRFSNGDFPQVAPGRTDSLRCHSTERQELCVTIMTTDPTKDNCKPSRLHECINLLTNKAPSFVHTVTSANGHSAQDTTGSDPKTKGRRTSLTGQGAAHAHRSASSHQRRARRGRTSGAGRAKGRGGTAANPTCPDAGGSGAVPACGSNAQAPRRRSSRAAAGARGADPRRAAVARGGRLDPSSPRRATSGPRRRRFCSAVGGHPFPRTDSPLLGLGKLSCRWKTTFSTKCWMLLCSGPRTNTIQSWVKPSTVGFFLTWARCPSSSFT